MADLVNHPSHYNQNGVETIDIIQKGMNKENYLGFLLGNIVKYLDRYQFKNGEEDLKKAQWYAKRMEQDLPLERTYTSYITELVDGNFENAVKLWYEYRNNVMNNFRREKCQKIDEYMDRYLNQRKLEDIKKAQEYAKELFNINGGDLEEYEPWFIELHEGNFKIAVRLWEEIS